MSQAGPLWYSLALLVGMAGYAALHHGLLALRQRLPRSTAFAILAALIGFHGLIRLIREQNDDRDVHLLLTWWQWLSELLSIPAYGAFILILLGRPLRTFLMIMAPPVVLLLLLHLISDHGFAVTSHGPVVMRRYVWGESLYGLQNVLGPGYGLFAVLAVGVVILGVALSVLHLRRRQDLTAWALAASTAAVLVTVVLAILNDLGIRSGVPLLIDHAFVLFIAVHGLILGDEALRLTAVERDLTVSRERLAGMLDSLVDAVVLIGPDGRIAEWNPAAERLTGIPAAEAIQAPPERHLHITDLENGDPIAPWSSDCAPGSLPPARISEATVEIRVVDLGDGRRDGRLLILRDITEVMRIREGGEHARRMESIGHLAGGVAHDFNNLLSAILGSAELLRIDGRRSEGRRSQAEQIDVIVTAVEQARSLSDQLLAFSRKGASLRRRFDLHDAINDAVALLRRSLDPRITIVTELKAQRRIVTGDRRQFANALLNLGINARDAMPEGGTFRLSTSEFIRTTPTTETAPTALDAGTFVVVRVSDTGSGIPAEILPRIFEPYFTTKTGSAGTGLGLAAVYGCVAEIGGAIQVESVVGRGTVFALTIPADGGTAEATALTDVQAVADPVDADVLVVDDDEVVRTITVGLLTNLGYRCRDSASGADALIAVERDPPDLIVLDAVMPGMNGLEVLRRLRTAGSTMPVLLCSGYGEGGDIQAMHRLGLAGVLRKPFRYDELRRACARALGARSRSGTDAP